MALSRLERQIDYLLELNQRSPVEQLSDDDIKTLVGSLGYKAANTAEARFRIMQVTHSFSRKAGN